MNQVPRLLVPGPTQLPPEVINELAQPMIYHRGKEFTEITKNVVSLLKQLFFTAKNDILLIPSSGRGAMEAAIANLFSPGERVLAVSNGYFGEVFLKIASEFGLSINHIRFNWTDPINYNIVEQALITDKHIKGILFTHCETTNAVENDLEAIGALAEKYNKLLIVDAVSSCGCMPIKLDEYNIDVAVTASQKGLMTPPGMSIATVSPKAWKAVENARLPHFYFDFVKMREFIDKGQTPVSTPVPLVRGLNAALELMAKESFEKVFERHRKLAAYIRGGAVELGYSLFPGNSEVKRADSLSAFLLPPEIKAETLVNHILTKYNTLFAKGLSETASSVLRIGHMGWFHEEDANHVLNVLENTKYDLGF